LNAVPFFRPFFSSLEDLPRFGRVLTAAGLLGARDFRFTISLLGASAGVAIVFEGLANPNQCAVS